MFYTRKHSIKQFNYELKESIMYNNTYDLGTSMSFIIAVGLVMIKLFGKFAKRDSSNWDKSYEKRRMKITRIVFMCFWGIYVVASLLTLIFGWGKIRDNQKVSYVSYVMLGLSLFFYELTFRQSPRGIWVKIRKIFAYILICALYIAVLPTTLLQFTTGRVPGVYGNAIGTILIGNVLIYGISILIIWLLLKQYRGDKCIPYTKKESKKNIDFLGLIQTEKNNKQDEVLLPNNHIATANSRKKPQRLYSALKHAKLNNRHVHHFLIYYAILVVIYLVYSSLCIIGETYTGIMTVIGVFIFPSLLPIGLYWLVTIVLDNKDSKDNKRKILAYYLIYEIVLAILTIVLLIIADPYKPDTKVLFILMAIMTLLSFLPIGISYIKQLLKDGKTGQSDLSTRVERQGNERMSPLKKTMRFLKEKKKWFLGGILLIVFIVGGIFLYNYIHDEYIPKKKLDEAATEILDKFDNEETRTEYAEKILTKEFDWGYNSILYDYMSGNDYITTKLCDYREAAYAWIENLAYQGNTKCQILLGNMFFWGDSYYIFKGESYTMVQDGNKYTVKCDKEKAAYWWLEAARNGDICAYNNAGMCYKDGTGVTKDMYKAIEWLRKGAEAGEPYAQKNYGDLFLEGVNVKVGQHKETRITKDYYYGSNDYIISQYIDGNYNLVTKYFVEVADYKTLIAVDIEQAKYWWTKSAAQGNDGAKERLQKIYE